MAIALTSSDGNFIPSTFTGGFAVLLSFCVKPGLAAFLRHCASVFGSGNVSWSLKPSVIGYLVDDIDKLRIGFVYEH